MTTQPTSLPSNTAASWRERLAVNFLRVALLFGLVEIIPAIINAFRQNEWQSVISYPILYLVGLIGAFVPMPYRLRATITLGLIFYLGMDALSGSGLHGAANIYFFAFSMLALLLFSVRVSFIAFGVSFLTMLIMGVLFNVGLFTPTAPGVVRSDWLDIADVLGTFTLLNIPVIIGINLLQSEFTSTQARERDALNNLSREQERLEDRIAERTRMVERRTVQIATGAEIARAAGTELDPVKLLNQVVNLIKNRFELYYAGAFLVDEQNKFAVLQAGTGEAGESLLAIKHRLEVGGQSMIGQAISTQQARIALDVGQEAVRFNNPHLPLTRSEMALPLNARNRTIGALTIQSDQPTAFTPEDIVSLQSMADLIAIALDNARLFQETQHSLDEVTRLHQGYITQAWGTGEGESGPPTYVYAEESFERAPNAVVPEFERVTHGKEPIIANAAQGTALTVPIRLRDQVIGALAVEDDSPSRIWTAEELALIESVLEQTALSLENARLLQETENALSESRRLANREQTVNAISSKIRRLPSVESVLTTALVELGRTLGASRGLVRLGATTRRIAELEEPNE